MGRGVRIGGHSSKDELEVGVEADAVALGNDNLVHEGSLADQEGFTSLGINEGEGQALASRADHIAGQAKAVGLEDGAAAVASQGLNIDGIDIREGSILTNETKRVCDLRSYTRRLDNVVEGHNLRRDLCDPVL